MKQREVTKRIIYEPAKSRLKDNQCPACGKPKEKWDRRTDWRCCSVKCTEKFQDMYIIYSWQDIRLKAFERDNFACVKCGKKPITFHERYDSESEEDFKWRAEKYDGYRFVGYVKGGYNVFDTSKLIGDHIIPIALGGDEWNLDNIQTLCIKCDKKKTKKDAKKIAKQRSIEKKLIKGQRQIK